MMKYIVTLPKIDTRYTAQWYDMIVRYVYCRGLQDEVKILGSEKEYKVPPTEFLDYRDYVSFVFPLIVEVVKKVKSGDMVFFLDGETPGLEAIEYVRKMVGENVELRAYWHAGTYDEHDLTYLRGVKGEYFERGWFDILDKIYVGSEYHKKLIVNKRNVDETKIVVTGAPMLLSEMLDGNLEEKKYNVVFTGRLGYDKGYDIVQELRKKGIDILATMEHQFRKKEYYRVIAQSKLVFSPSRHELFGLGVVEALASNVPVLVPDSMPVYREIVPAEYRYKNLDDVDWAEQLEKWKEKKNLRKLVEKYDYNNVIGKWLE
jgi:glycosyltransferase involved in cell wall biosynthesis